MTGGFCSYKMFAVHLWAEQEIKFVIKVEDTQIMVREFVASNKPESIVYLPPNAGIIKSLRDSGFIVTKQTLLKLRLIRVNLGKTIEGLVTNLWEEEGHPKEAFESYTF